MADKKNNVNHNFRPYEKEVEKDKVKGIVVWVTGFLSALAGFLATLNIEYEWLTDESISAFGALLAAAIFLIVNGYAIWKNTFVGKKAKEQNRELYQQNKKQPKE